MLSKRCREAALVFDPKYFSTLLKKRVDLQAEFEIFSRLTTRAVLHSAVFNDPAGIGTNKFQFISALVCSLFCLISFYF
jgi:hypothetical protein